MAETRAKAIGIATVRLANGIVDFVVLVAILLLIAISMFALWDSDQVYRAASATRYTAYRPSAKVEENIPFAELQAINPEVIAWLTVYGTNIDYPVTQSDDNEKYVSTDAFGAYSASGAIFLDYMNNKNFEDFNSILYGHHMEKQAMFGAIGLFSSRTVFDDHAYGNLYLNGVNMGLQIFAFVKTDAYNSGVFTPNIQREEDRQAYLDNLMENALYTRDVEISTRDRIVLLSTCSTDSTNERDILVAKITNEHYSDGFSLEETDDTPQRVSVDQQISPWEQYPIWEWIAVIGVLLLLIVLIVKRIVKGNRTEEQR